MRYVYATFESRTATQLFHKYFLAYNLSGGTEQKHENPQQEWCLLAGIRTTPLQKHYLLT